MIKIDIFRTPAKLISGFSVSGHANTAPHGQDIVCAAVSALTQTAVLGLEGYLQHSIILEIAHGKLEVELKDLPNQLTEAILATMLLGLLEIEKINPQSVRISEHRR
jgi:uncharacterized protein YsxB (DUF464 family)